jgi:hypothetical protein
VPVNRALAIARLCDPRLAEDLHSPLPVRLAGQATFAQSFLPAGTRSWFGMQDT